MKLNKDIFSERNRIINKFCLGLGYAPLNPHDIADHRCQLEKVYKGMLHEACVIDDCCRRFKRTFEERRFMIIE